MYTWYTFIYAVVRLFLLSLFKFFKNFPVFAPTTQFTMYQLHSEPFGPFTRYALHHSEVGTSFSVVPEIGATLTDLIFKGRGIIDGIDTPEALAKNTGGKSSLLFPFPNRLENGQYEWEGKAYQFPINDERTGNAIHGFVRELPFEIERIQLAKHYATIELGLHYSGQLPYYPFPFQLNITYSIYDHGVFRLSVNCRNLHFYDIPVGFGWHPYFILGDSANDTSLRLPDVELQEINDKMLPTGERIPYPAFSALKPLENTNLDNAFGVLPHQNQYEVVVAGKGCKLVLRAEREKFPYFMVFIPGERRTVALEPMSCNINAFNTRDALSILSPDEVWEGMVEFQFTSL